jgi:hypothetical protein
MPGAISCPVDRERLPLGSRGKRHDTDDRRLGLLSPSAGVAEPPTGSWLQQLAVQRHSSMFGQQQRSPPTSPAV